MFENAVGDRSAPTLSATRRRGHVPARRHDVSLADARLPDVDRDGRASGRPPHPAPRLVAPRRAAHRRVRLVLRRDPRGRDAPLDPRHDRRHEPRPPCRRTPRRSTRRRSAPASPSRPSTSPATAGRTATADGAGIRPGDVRAAALLLLQPLRVGSDRRAARRARPRAAAASTSTPPPPAAGSSRATASTCSSTTSPTSTSRRTCTGRTACASSS